MALWWCCFPLLFSSLLWQTNLPVHAAPSCPRSCSCPGVKEVHCTFRHLTTIPKSFPKDTERLNLGYNSLTEVEGSEFGSLRQLEMLMLHGNDINAVHPGAFYSLRSLQILKLSYNKLTSVNSGVFEGLNSLIRLHLDHNLIDFIEPYTFAGLPALKLLQLEGNLLKEIHPHTFITVSLLGSFWTSGLRHLHLSDNLLEQLPAAALKTAPRLELLLLHGNPWTCDCQLHWLQEWSSTHEGVIKCKKERGSSEVCPQCSSPLPLNGTQFLGLAPDKLTCERPSLRSPLKLSANPVWAESDAEPDLPYTRDFEKPLGDLTFVLSDSHGNSAHLACEVRHPGESSPMTWTANPLSPGELSVNVSLVTVLECEIDRETLQNLWQLVAYYYESPAILERGQQKGNASRITYQYAQTINENSPYFTDLKGYLVAEPAWLLQPRVTLRLNRKQTTTKKLVMDFTTVITKHINSHGGQDDDDTNVAMSWALLRRGTVGRVQTALEGSKVHLECSVLTSDAEVKVEWMLPDLSIVEDATDDVAISEKGQLVILNATVSDSGLYHCLVRTKAGVDLIPLRLTVKERSLGPTAFNGQKIVVEKGRSFSLPCEVTSVQPSQTTWYLPKNQILLPTQKTRGAEVMENGTLVVRRSTQEDAGEYSCVASNIYGVDMLTHMVEVTGEKASEKSKAQTEKEQKIFPLAVLEEGEGSGADYQEIIRPSTTQFPRKVGTRQRNPNGFPKRVRIKDSKRKPNTSVKELDPNRWAEILAKAKAKPSVALPTEQSLQEPSTVTLQTITPEPTTITATPTTTIATTPDIVQPSTHLGISIKPTEVKTDTYSTNRKESDISESPPQSLPPPPPRSTEPTPRRVDGMSEKAESVPDRAAVERPQPGDRSGNRQSGEGRRNYNLVPGGGSNRRRPPFRRRKPQRGRPNVHHPSKKPQTTAMPTTMITTTVPTTTPTPTTTAPATTPVPTTVESGENLSAEYEIEEDEGEYNEEYKDSDSSEANEDLNIETSHTTNDLERTFTTVQSAREQDSHEGVSSSRHNSPNPKTIVPPKLDSTPHPTERTVAGKEKDIVNPKKSEGNDKHIAGESESELLTAKDGQEKHEVGTDSSKKHLEKLNRESVTQNYNTKDRIPSRTQNRQKPDARPSPEQNTPTQAKSSSPTVITSLPTNGRAREEVARKEDKGVSEPKAKPEIPSFPIPVHPWLHPIKQDRVPTSTSRTTHVDHDSTRNTGRQGVVSPGRHSQPPRVQPTSHWPSHHNRHSHHYPSWPGQGSFPHPRQGTGSHLVPTHRPWPFPHPWAQSPMVTNRPEVIAETAKPTPSVPGTSSKAILSNPHLSHNQHNHQNPQVDSRTQTRDQLFLSRLRNRYRQAQLDRIAQLGKMATPKPHVSYKIPAPPIIPKPTASHTHKLQPLKPAKPSSSSFSGFIPTQRPYHPTTAVIYGGRWPVGAGRISSRRPTAAPPFPRVVVAENGGVKPRITTVTTASVTVLAESDVYLPCKATGNPEPSIAWTKVSTGATITAETKHGPRFEVFKNGTFVIKNIQIQDRGQYLCNAHNRFGSDRMVITLSVQTETPKIQPPKSTAIAVYLGKSVALDCLASGKPPAKISWILPNGFFVGEVGTVQTASSPMVLLQNGTLQIVSPNFSSKGDYKCIASNAAGADTIIYHLHVAALPPSISEGEMDTVIIPPDRSVYVHCSVKGAPLPILKWTLPTGVHVKPSQFLGRRLFVFPNGTLYVKNVLPADAGRYECSAMNAVGISKRTVQLEVRADSASFPRKPPPPPPLPVPPTQRHGVPSRQHSVSAMYGSAVYLHCPESPGFKRGTIWQLPSKTIMEHRYSPERPIKVFHNGTLRILQLTEVDGGNYLCVFQRPNGEDMELFQVEVLMTPPRIEQVRTAQTRVTFGENFQVDCVATGLPDPEVSWSLPDGTLINNALQSDDSGIRNRRYVIFGNGTLLLQQMGKKDEGDYTCHARNKLGKAERKVNVKVGPNAPKIRSKSDSLVSVKLGQSATMSCQATGEPKPKIMWISPRNDVISTTSQKFQIMDDGTLVVKKVILADEGKYACVARNSAGDDVKNMKLEVVPQEAFINGMKGSVSRVLAVSYQTALLDCKVEGKPEPKIWWVTPYGHSLATPYLGGRFQVHRNGSLELRGVRKADEGNYICRAKNNLGEASLLVELDVASIAEKPSFAVPNIEILPIKQDGGIVFLECPARGKPNPEFAWVLPNGTMLTPGVRLQRFTHHLGNGTLQISQAVASDKGVYRCLAKNVAGQAEKRYALEAGRKPVIRGSTGGMKINYGLNLNLPCTVDGWPQASITWTLPNGLVLDKPQAIGRVLFLADGTLQIKKVASFDKGTYTCRASNSFGSSTLSYPVAVMVFPPRITNVLTSITRVNRGSPVTLNCVATGIPKPDISWTLPGRTTLVPHNRFTAQGGIHMTEGGSLVIQNPMLMNSGIYKCNAKNALGTDFKSTYLQVL